MCPNQGSEVVLLRLLGFGTFLIQVLLIKPPLCWGLEKELVHFALI